MLRKADQRRGDADTGDHGPATGSFHHTGAGGFPDSGEGRADFPAAEQRSHRAGNQRKKLLFAVVSRPGHAGPQDQGLFGDALKSRGCSSGISEKGGSSGAAGLT